jgi:hypothetical protein
MFPRRLDMRFIASEFLWIDLLEKVRCHIHHDDGGGNRGVHEL